MEYLIPIWCPLCLKLSKNIVGQGFHTAAVIARATLFVCPMEQQ